MTPRLRVLTLVVALAAVAFSACAGFTDPAAAVVAGDKIRMSEVTAAAQQFAETEQFQRLAEQGDAQAIKRQFEQGYLSQLIRRAVLAPRAEKLGLTVTDADVAERINEIKNDFPSESAFQEALKEQGLTRLQLNEIIFDQILEERLRADIAGQLRGTAQDEAFQEYLEEAYDSADIEVNPRYGTFDVQTQQVVDTPASEIPGADEPEREQAPGETAD